MAPTPFTFDQCQLRRWDINETLLPVDSLIENQATALLEQKWTPSFRQLYSTFKV
jgi:hypothetical protein